ncbi:MAG: hypothetical protein J0L97_05960 [Alphaproteobacteria bacterium]|nr:hypothetical protein [Alphaproteobacteria bacterium]
MAAALLVIVAMSLVFLSQSIKMVPMRQVWSVERQGKFHRRLLPGLNFIIPFFERISFKEESNSKS